MYSGMILAVDKNHLAEQHRRAATQRLARTVKKASRQPKLRRSPTSASAGRSVQPECC
jgi:hypothetical protein